MDIQVWYTTWVYNKYFIQNYIICSTYIIYICIVYTILQIMIDSSCLKFESDLERPLLPMFERFSVRSEFEVQSQKFAQLDTHQRSPGQKGNRSLSNGSGKHWEESTHCGRRSASELTGQWMRVKKGEMTSNLYVQQILFTGNPTVRSYNAEPLSTSWAVDSNEFSIWIWNWNWSLDSEIQILNVE